MLPRPARIAISRTEGRPAAECSSSRRAKSSVIGPGGVGSLLIAPTPEQPPRAPIMYKSVITCTLRQYPNLVSTIHLRDCGHANLSTAVKARLLSAILHAREAS